MIDADFEKVKDCAEALHDRGDRLAHFDLDDVLDEHDVALSRIRDHLIKIELWTNGACKCDNPLRGFRPESGFRCRLCNQPLGQERAYEMWTTSEESLVARLTTAEVKNEEWDARLAEAQGTNVELTEILLIAEQLVEATKSALLYFEAHDGDVEKYHEHDLRTALSLHHRDD